MKPYSLLVIIYRTLITMCFQTMLLHNKYDLQAPLDIHCQGWKVDLQVIDISVVTHDMCKGNIVEANFQTESGCYRKWKWLGIGTCLSYISIWMSIERS